MTTGISLYTPKCANCGTAYTTVSFFLVQSIFVPPPHLRYLPYVFSSLPCLTQIRGHTGHSSLLPTTVHACTFLSLKEFSISFPSRLVELCVHTHRLGAFCSQFLHKKKLTYLVNYVFIVPFGRCISSSGQVWMWRRTLMGYPCSRCQINWEGIDYSVFCFCWSVHPFCQMKSHARHMTHSTYGMFSLKRPLTAVVVFLQQCYC